MENRKDVKIHDIGDIQRNKDIPERFLFPFPQMNYLLNGGLFDRVTMISSGTDNGKSTLSSQIIASCIDQGYKCCCFFGEDTKEESQDRIFKQAVRGMKDSIEYKQYYANNKLTNCGEYVLTDEAYNFAKNKFKNKLFLYDTEADATIDSILSGFEKARVEHGCRIFLLDNVDQFQFASENENKAIRDIVVKIRDYAINHKVHIFLVAHVRKTERDLIVPSLYDVKGTSSMVNISKNVMFVVRMDKVDKTSKQYKTLRQILELNKYDLDKADCLINVAKTKGRKLGWVCLKFDNITQTYSECEKIDKDNSAIETNKSIVRPISTDEISFDILEDEDLPF